MTPEEYEAVHRGIMAAAAEQNRRLGLLVMVGIFSRCEFRAFLRGLANHCRVTWTEHYLQPWEIHGDGVALDAVRCYVKAKRP